MRIIEPHRGEEDIVSLRLFYKLCFGCSWWGLAMMSLFFCLWSRDDKRKKMNVVSACVFYPSPLGPSAQFL